MSNSDRVFSLQENYQNILLNDGGLRSLCNLLSQEIGNKLFILDKYRENILYIDRELRGRLDFYSYLDNRKPLMKDMIYKKGNNKIERVEYKYNNDIFTEFQVRLGNNNDFLGVLVIFEDEALKEEDYPLILQGVYAITLKLHQNSIIQRLSQKCSNELIDNLLQGKIKDEEELVKSGELAGWDLRLPYQLFLIRANSFKDSEGERGNSLYNYEMDDKLIQSLHSIIRSNISRKYIVFYYNNHILLLINYEKPSKEVKDDLKTIYKLLEKRFLKLNISIGAGSFLYNCLNISFSYKQALYALDFLDISNKDNRTLFYEDLGILKLLWKVECKDLIEFKNDLLSDLITYDKDNNSDLVNTLGILLKNDGSIKNSSSQLHIHPNTARYRIKKIEKILKVDISDFEVKLNLATAYKINKFIVCEDGKCFKYD